MNLPATVSRLVLFVVVWPLVGCLAQHLGSQSCSGGSEQSAEEPAKPRTPVPDAASIATARELIKKAYADDYTAVAEDPEPLIQKLLLAVVETDDAARKYAMLLEAEQVAIAGRDINRAIEIVDLRADAFDVDCMGCRVESLASFLLPKAYSDANLMVSLSEVALASASECVDVEQLVHAKAAAEIAVKAAKKVFLVGKATRNEWFVEGGQEKQDQARNLLKLISRRMDTAAVYKAALETLSKNPEDPAAQSVVGRYLCLTLNGWDCGLPLLAKGSQKDLADVADMEMKTLADPKQDVQAAFVLAGKWWDIAESEGYAQEEVVALKRHAGILYDAVSKRLADPLELALAEKRIAAKHGPLGTSSLERLPEQIMNSVGMKMILVRPGKFLRGAKRGDVLVTIAAPFYIAQTEVTQAQWRRVMETTPWSGSPHVHEAADAPASFVTWNDAISFCKRLTELEHRKRNASREFAYSLPMEAQWEYACRAGTQSVFCFGDDPAKLSDYGWWGGHLGPPGNARSEQYAHPVAKKKPNQWQLFDMHGNQWEWCGDDDNRHRVLRGGSWNGEAHLCESGSRETYPPDFKDFSVGFRVVGLPLAMVSPEAAVLEEAPGALRHDLRPRTIVVHSTKPWQSAGVVGKGARLTLSAKGTWVGFTPDGDRLHRFPHDPIPDVPSCALLGRIGHNVFVVGSGTSLIAPQDGILEFRINDADQFLFDNVGTLEVSIKESP